MGGENVDELLVAVDFSTARDITVIDRYVLPCVLWGLVLPFPRPIQTFDSTLHALKMTEPLATDLVYNLIIIRKYLSSQY